MRLIGVIDLAGGRAVHARGGKRDAYTPVRSALLGPGEEGDPVALARAYLRYPVPEIYVADLDAIAGAPLSPVVGHLASLGAAVWLDAGRSTLRVAPNVRPVVGLETMLAWEEVTGAAFSLDLRAGRPLTGGEQPAELAKKAVQAGATAVILLDLAKVGSMAGLDWVTVQAVRASTLGVELVVGGGVRDRSDIARLTDLGCDGALVATALHEPGHEAF
ncbi:MAG TPA: HisA/HisF-related TIM barrel protein [Gemmatimonadaceae bacterium]|nr:HisA/HisF-related TIM barrel protein [Gemmatimonadaceae bacterium]